MRFLVTLSSLVVAVLAASRTTPPSGALTVGSSGEYSTIQKAVDALSTTSTSWQSIFIFPGTYTGQVIIPSLKSALTIYGSTSDTSSYTSNSVNIIHSSSLASGAADDEHTGTVINLCSNTKFYNVNIKNTYGKGSQAIALSAYNAQQGYYGVALYGYQDTLLAQTGTQVYAKCYIQGAVDYIFGQHAVVWIDSSTLAVSAGGGAITANGRATSSDASFYVINKSTVTTASGSSVSSGSVYLGRPWSQYARVIFQNTALSSIINSAGWEVWNGGDARTGSVTFEEYGNTGSGASGTRASFSSKLSVAVSISTILGSSYTSWVDTTYLS